MWKLNYRRGTAGIILPLALLAGAAPAFAQVKHSNLNQKGFGSHAVTHVRGTVTGWNAGNGNLQIQTKTGSVTMTVTSTTHVIRMVAGSLADLKTKQHIEAHVVSGTTTIDSIQIDAVMGTKPKDQHVHSNASQPPHPKLHTGTTPPAKLNTHPKPDLHQPTGYVSGQISSVGGKTITLQGWNNKTTTYTLSSSLTITKAIVGSSGDLAFGETVQAEKDSGGNAASITIINA
jgi:hypothetical protein